ncbi:MAG: outer membrane beta-barrel family protein, partial [Muribaculaceae bacterium]|nr:outer membrane beta-barrel family protein [Muribaculaceae bacterium]
TIDMQLLDEVVVEGRTQRVIKHGVEYTPAKKIKRTSIDATNLLYQMQIPQLDITPGSSQIKTLTGKAVAIYIDYRPATDKDLQGLRPEDVLRVEVLNYPDDARFLNAEHVVNFIMQRYEWGGYTKFTAQGRTLANNNISGDIYSKFVFKKWTFDANVSADWHKQNKAIVENKQIFRDVVFNGQTFREIVRNSITDSYIKKVNSQWASLRASYETEATLVEHALSFGRYSNPKNLTTMKIYLESRNELFNPSNAFQDETGRSIYPALHGFYRFRLPKDNTVSVIWDFSYTSSKRNSCYHVGDKSPIVNDNNEKAYSSTVNIGYSKRFSHNNTFHTSLITFNKIFNTSYLGSYTGVQKLLSSESLLLMEYSQSWNFGLNLFSRVGLSNVVGRTNEITTLNQWNPRLGIQLEYRCNDKHSVSIDGWWGNTNPEASTSNDAIVQSNELLWLQGNPDLRNENWLYATASYTFIPNDKLSLSAIAQYGGNYNQQTYEFYSVPGKEGLIRQYINSGNNYRYAAGASAALRLFDKSLSLRAIAAAQRNVFTGNNEQSLNTLYGKFDANYSRNCWSASIYYITPMKYLATEEMGAYISTDCSYGLSFNYAVGNVKASLSFSNWFSKNGYVYYRYTSPRYSEQYNGWDLAYSRSINLTLTYTLPYGKKVSADDEISKNQNINSAILR